MNSLDVVGTAVTLESVLCTEELDERQSRPPDYTGEIHALRTLLQQLRTAPSGILQKLVETALDLCRAHSAGISLLEDGDPGNLSPKGDHFRWHAVAGQWAPLIWNTTTARDNGPCGTVLDRDRTLLFANAHRYYQQFAGVFPLLVEGLLVPFHVDGRAVGTVWVIAHDDSRHFDAEDRRLLESLANFAATAYQVRSDLQTLKQSDLELREADRHKSEFLATLSHELRNPLGAIASTTEVLQLSGPDVAKPATEMMQRQISQMRRLIDDLLDVSRITRGEVEICSERISLASIVHQSLEVVRPRCDSMEQTLTVSIPAEPVYLDGDPTRLAQVVTNLLNNACKFTERKGHIALKAARETGPEERIVIRVRDTGIGIDAELLSRIFGMFTQAGASPGRSREGLGIGLAIAKKLVELHGGTIEARSDGPGRGSEFVVRLPVAAEPPKT